MPKSRKQLLPAVTILTGPKLCAMRTYQS